MASTVRYTSEDSLQGQRPGVLSGLKTYHMAIRRVGEVIEQDNSLPPVVATEIQFPVISDLSRMLSHLFGISLTGCYLAKVISNDSH